jgi:RNA polymerase sigma-70 factor (ECF subfamily)
MDRPVKDPTASQPSDLIRQARAGDRQALGALIDAYRPYLKLLARLHQDSRMQAKLDDSDLVQDVLMLAIRDFSEFRGVTEPEFTSWLRTIMARVAAKSVRHFRTRRRDIALEQNLQVSLDQSSWLLSSKLAAPDETPSQEAAYRERAVLVAEALERLPEHYREVVILRDFEGLTPKEIGQRLNRTPDAVCKIWARAMAKVRQLLKGKV